MNKYIDENMSLSVCVYMHIAYYNDVYVLYCIVLYCIVWYCIVGFVL